jgi:hypothetical protein
VRLDGSANPLVTDGLVELHIQRHADAQIVESVDELEGRLGVSDDSGELIGEVDRCSGAVDRLHGYRVLLARQEGAIGRPRRAG